MGKPAALPEDFIRAGGYMTLGSRLKRIGERMQADVTRLGKAEGVAVQASLWPLLGVLDRAGVLTVGGLAVLLGVAQPGVTRALAELRAAGLVRSGTAAADQRQRTVRLTAKGAALVATARKDLWTRIAQAVAEICGGLDGTLLDQLAGLESALDANPLNVRAARTPKGDRRDRSA